MLDLVLNYSFNQNNSNEKVLEKDRDKKVLKVWYL